MSSKLEKFIAHCSVDKPTVGVYIELLDNLNLFKSQKSINQLMSFLSGCGIRFINFGSIFSKKNKKEISCFALDESIITDSIFDYKINLTNKNTEILDLFKNCTDIRLRSEFSKFCSTNEYWLDDYAIFCSIASQVGTYDFSKWPDILRTHSRKPIEVVKKQLPDEILSHKLLQFFAHKQMATITECAHRYGMLTCIDCDMLCENLSAEVWSHQDNFFLDNLSKPTVFVGIPPSNTVANGIKFTKVPYRSANLKTTKYELLDNVFSHSEQVSDSVFLLNEHSIFQIWEIASSEMEPKYGRWINAPSDKFFEYVGQHFNDFPYLSDFNEPLFPNNEILAKRHNILQIVIDGEPCSHSCEQFNLNREIFGMASKSCNKKVPKDFTNQKISTKYTDEYLSLVRKKGYRLCLFRFDEIMQISGMQNKNVLSVRSEAAQRIKTHISNMLCHSN